MGNPIHRAALGIGLLLAAPAGAAEDRAAAVLAAARAATGGAALAEIAAISQTATVQTSGLDGPAHALIDVRSGAYTDDYVLGPMKGAEGFDGAEVWSVDATGQPRTESGGEARANAVNTAYRNSLAYWFPERHKAAISYAGEKAAGGATYDLVRIVPEGGRPFTFWVDKATHLITRMQEQTETDLRTETYSDFRDVGGAKLPYRTVTSIGDPKYDQVAMLTRLTVLPGADAAKFRKPAPPPPDFTFPDGVAEVTLPIRLVSNHIYLDVTVGGRAVPFIFDTGAINVLSKEWMRGLGVTDQGALPGSGVGEAKQEAGLARVGKIDVGGLVLRDQVFATLAWKDLQRLDGAQSAGLIGYEVAKRTVVTIDYAGRTISFRKPETFTPPAGVAAIPLSFNEHTPQIMGAIDGIPAKLDLDTGSRSTIDVTAPFAAAHKLDTVWKLSPPAMTGFGIGGAVHGRVGRGHSLTLGNVTLTDPLVEVSLQTKGAFASPYFGGNVGGGVLRHFTVTLDYPHQRLFLVPNGDFAEKDVFDRTGMALRLTEDGAGFEVLGVTAGSAAAGAGIATGDVITSVDGTPAAELRLPKVRAKFRGAEGTRVTLGVLHGGEKRGVTIALKDVF